MSVQTTRRYPKSPLYDQTAYALADSRYETAPEGYKIYWFPDEHEEIVRFIEVDANTIPTGEVIIFRFGRNDVWNFRSEIAQVTPQEWDGIESGAIPLPKPWRVKSARLIERHAASQQP